MGPRGFEICLTDISEPALKRRLLQDMQVDDCRAALNHVFEKYDCDESLEYSFRHGQWMEPIKQLVSCRTKRGLKPALARVLTKLVGGGLVTGHMLHKWGYATSGLCPYCGRCDTLEHRLFDCDQYGRDEREGYPKWICELAAKTPLNRALVARCAFEPYRPPLRTQPPSASVPGPLSVAPRFPMRVCRMPFLGL